MFRHALIWSTLLATALVSRSSEAQLAPTGALYGRPSDTGFAGPNEQGGYSATVPLDLPPSRGGLPIPLQIVSGTRGFGAVGVGWDIPFSYVYVDHTFAHRRPAGTPTYGIAARERVTVSLLGRNMEMLRQSDTVWIARNDPTVTMTAVEGRWQVVDANGVSYSFKKDVNFSSTGGPGFDASGGLWLLDTISGRGGAKVQLDYTILTPDGPTGPRISIDLQDIKYNPDANGCFKHEIDLSYEQVDAGATPQAISILGERVLVRYHKLDSVVVRSHTVCGDPPSQLRSYELKYSADQDTRQPRLSTVLEHGRPDITSGTQTLPVATYHYGTASTLYADGHVELDYGPSATSTQPSGSSANDATDTKTTLFQPPVSGSAYASWQTLQDFNGDGRADLIFTNFTTGQLEISAAQPGGGFGSAVPLADGTFTRNVIDARSSSVDRFASETTTDDQMQDFVWTQSVDVNGDGRIDILDAAEKPHTWVAYLNTPDSGPSGVKWVRRELDVSRLQTQLLHHGLNVPTDYLPLSGRRTGRDIGYQFHWVWNDADQKYEISAALGDLPVLDWGGDEQTYTEFKLVDINGDGYPDVVFNTSPLGYPLPDAPRTQNGINHDPYYADSHLHFGMTAPNTIGVAYNTGGVFLEDTPTNPFSDEVSLVTPSDCGVEWWSGDDTLHDRKQVLHCSFADVNGDGLVDRVEGKTVSLGTGFDFRTVQLTLPANFLASQESGYLDKCNQGSDTFTSNETIALRDLTGDGIPDLEVGNVDDTHYEVFVGTGAGFSTVAMPTDVPVTQIDERCNGGGSWTVSGLYDINGDGRPDVVSIAGQISVSQLSGGSRPGDPEAGRITAIDNGYGATTSVSYMSAKEDTRTAHSVPFPEIVVSSVKTDGTFGLGGTLAATNYAYGKIGMFYDSVLDGFRSLGYQRRVAVTTTGTAKDGSPVASATVTDAYPLEADTPANFYYLSEKQRVGRYLEAGRISDTTALAGNIGTDPWALLSVDVTTDVHRIAGMHYSIDTGDTHYYADATSPSAETCVDVAFPYDFHTSKTMNTYDPCSARGFLYTRSTQSWRGSEAPPSQKNVQVYTSVRSVDDFGRVTSILYQNDATQDNDDVCVDTTYASPTDSVFHVLSAPATRKVWACGYKEDGHTVAEESWEYDKEVAGFVFQGLPRAHTVYRHATDTGVFLGMSREYDADYDALGNPVKITTTRDDNAWRTTTIGYDAFGISPTGADVVGSDATMRHFSQITDPISDALLSSTDENGTTHGYTWDAFGRLSTTTVQRHDDAEAGTLRVRTYDEDSCTPHGRRVTVQTFTDPVMSGDASAVAHVSSTCLDELGRERFSEIQLGGDYNATLIAGKRTYDQVGRTVFEADAYQKGQNETTAYGTSRFFNDDGSLSLEIRGPGPQQYTVTPDPTNEIYPTAYWHTFDNHLETTAIKTADALTTGTPQETVYRQAVSTGIGRVLVRSTYQNDVPIELATFNYDLLGNQSSIERFGDPVNANYPVFWSWQFDSLGHVTSLSEPANAPQTRTYDSWGELKKIEWQPTSPEPVHGIEMSYDSLGRTLSSYEENNHVLDPLTVNTYSYDVAGSSSRITPQYVMGRLAKASSPTEDIVLGYDGLGNVNARSFTDLNNVEYVEQQGTHADGSQAWIQLQLPDDGYAAERVDYEYDSASRLRWMWFSNATTTQELYNADQLDAWGRVRHAMFGATTYAANYFDVGRRLPKQVNVTAASGTRSINYDAFDAVGREASRTETVPNVGGTTTSTYDPLGRLARSVRVLSGSTKQNWSFNYDPLGNMSSFANSVAHSSVSFSYQSSGQTPDYDQLCTVTYFGHIPLQCNVAYDSFGNVVSEPASVGGGNSFSYFNSGDVKNISNTAGMTAKFAYDPFGDLQDLNIASTAGQVRHDQHFGDLITLRSQDAQSPSTSFISRQFPGPGLTISRRGSQGPWVFQFSEPRGTRFTVDANGAFLQDLSYTPYGAPTSTGATVGSATFTTDQWNSGDALEGFGLTKIGKRIYDPSIGRFLSRDPLAISRTAATTNPYALAFNDPVNVSDRSGLDPVGNGAINSSYSGDDDTGSWLAGAAAIAALIWQNTGNTPTPPQGVSQQGATAFSAAFNARVAALQMWQVIGPYTQYDPGFGDFLADEVGWRAYGVLRVGGGAAAVVGSTALTATDVGAPVGVLGIYAGADEMWAGFKDVVYGRPHQTSAAIVGGPTAEKIEAILVATTGVEASVPGTREGTAGSTGLVLDLFGGSASQIDGAVNVDLAAQVGIRADVNTFLATLRPGSVDAIVASGPRAAFLQNAAAALRTGGRIFINATKGNSYGKLPDASELSSLGLRVVQRSGELDPIFQGQLFRRNDGSLIPSSSVRTTILEKF